jgi:hypothetical protein
MAPQLIGQIGRGQTTEKILVHSHSVKERTAAHGQSYRGTQGIGGDGELIAVEPHGELFTDGTSRPSVPVKPPTRALRPKRTSLDRTAAVS